MDLPDKWFLDEGQWTDEICLDTGQGRGNLSGLSAGEAGPVSEDEGQLKPRRIFTKKKTRKKGHVNVTVPKEGLIVDRSNVSSNEVCGEAKFEMSKVEIRRVRNYPKVGSRLEINIVDLEKGDND